MSSYDYRPGNAADAGSSGAMSGGVPGKRALTQSLPPVQRRSLVDDQRLAFDNVGEAASDFGIETRSTIEGSTDPTPNLTDRQLERARRLNPGWIRRLKVASSVFSSAAVDSNAFAFDVAEKQAKAGVLCRARHNTPYLELRVMPSRASICWISFEVQVDHAA